MRTPQRPYRAIRSIVGTIAVLSVLGVWIHSHVTGQQLDLLWQLAALVIVSAGAIAVFGKGTFETAAETAKDLSGESDDDGEN